MQMPRVAAVVWKPREGTIGAYLTVEEEGHVLPWHQDGSRGRWMLVMFHNACVQIARYKVTGFLSTWYNMIRQLYLLTVEPHAAIKQARKERAIFEVLSITKTFLNQDKHFPLIK